MPFPASICTHFLPWEQPTNVQQALLDRWEVCHLVGNFVVVRKSPIRGLAPIAGLAPVARPKA